MVNPKPFQAYVFYNWCTHCYITISQFWKHRGQIHGGSSLSKSMSCLKFTRVRWNHCQHISSQVMLALLSHAPFAVNKLPHFYTGTYLLIGFNFLNIARLDWHTKVLISMLVRCDS